MTRRQERVGELVHAVISEILMRGAKDPRLSGVTVTHAEVSADLRNATIFFSVLGDAEEEKEALRSLQKASGYIRSELAKRAGLRFVPQIAFKVDPAVHRGQRVFELLESLKREEGSKPEPEPGPESVGPDQ
jgi:ribosome-binding factor A